MVAIAILICSAGLPLPDFLGMLYSPSIETNMFVVQNVPVLLACLTIYLFEVIAG
jgi:hypothetical protein